MDFAFPLRVGVDDIATETQKCDGWTYFCLPEVYVNEFSDEARKIIASSKLSIFHGKKFKVGHAGEYLAFLELIRKYQIKSMQTRAVNVLFSADFKAELQKFGGRLLPQVLNHGGVQSKVTTDLLLPYLAPLFTLARVAEGLAQNCIMQVEMDECNQLGNLGQHVHEKMGIPIEAHVILKAIYNGYAKKQFPKAPLLSDDGISVVRDTNSFLIQAADVIGNFSMAYVFVRLGKKSKTKEAKAALIEKVFGDWFNKNDFCNAVKLDGNDLVLMNGAASIQFQMGWEMLRAPRQITTAKK